MPRATQPAAGQGIRAVHRCERACAILSAVRMAMVCRRTPLEKRMVNSKQTLAYQSIIVLFMNKLFQTVAISALLLAPASSASAQINFGIRIGEPPAPRAYRVPPRPGPDYVWV